PLRYESHATLTRPSGPAAIAGFHSFPAEFDTMAAGENVFPCCVAAKMAALPSLHPCHATHTFPLESVAAAGSISEPGAWDNWIVLPGRPPSTTRAQISKLPF